MAENSSSANVEDSQSAYDVNFVFPIQELEDESIKLTPFIPSLHSDAFFAASKSDPGLWDYLPYGPFLSAAAFTHELIEARIQPDPNLVIFAILSKAHSSRIAGIIGFLNTSAQNLSTEIGFVTILPGFQGAGIASKAVHLLLAWCFDVVRLRRVQWKAHACNAGSLRVAEKAGFRREALVRWERVLPEGKIGNGKTARQGDRWEKRPGMDTILLAICWDDWCSR